MLTKEEYRERNPFISWVRELDPVLDRWRVVLTTYHGVYLGLWVSSHQEADATVESVWDMAWWEEALL
jgi:hypothetical protein